MRRLYIAVVGNKNRLMLLPFTDNCAFTNWMFVAALSWVILPHSISNSMWSFYVSVLHFGTFFRHKAFYIYWTKVSYKHTIISFGKTKLLCDFMIPFTILQALWEAHSFSDVHMYLFFLTLSSLSPIFNQCVARYMYQILSQRMQLQLQNNVH